MCSLPAVVPALIPIVRVRNFLLRPLAVGERFGPTENHYAPPPPYIAAEPFEPYALAAVELEQEGLVILGQVAKGVSVTELSIGMEVEVDLQVLYRDDDGVDHWVWTWAPAAPKGV